MRWALFLRNTRAPGKQGLCRSPSTTTIVPLSFIAGSVPELGHGVAVGAPASGTSNAAAEIPDARGPVPAEHPRSGKAGVCALTFTTTVVAVKNDVYRWEMQ
jgi:hypothetical protein